jgi:hypothetical protein
MACFEPGTIVTLPARQAITLPHVGGTTLRVAKGVVWLTEESHGHDVVLRPGDNWLVESDGNTVVEAQNDATFCVVGRKAEALKLPRHARPRSKFARTLASFFAAPARQLPYF